MKHAAKPAMFKVIDDHSVLVPAGDYYLGDPCYPVCDEDWDTLLASSACFERPLGHLREVAVLGFGTMYGDGGYDDQHGTTYSVDAGLIGLTPRALCPTDADAVARLERLGQFVTFTTDTTAYIDDALLVFGSYQIDTDPPALDEDAWHDVEEDEGEDD